MLKIKLFPRGKKHQRTFRIVVSESRSKNNGRFTDDLGFWLPQTKTVHIDQPKFDSWVKNGAQVTVGVDKLLHPDQHPRIKKKKPAVEQEVKPTPTPESTENSTK